MMSWVLSLVLVRKQGFCAGCCSAEPMKEKTGTGSSEYWLLSFSKCMVLPRSLGGVPVLSRPMASPSSLSWFGSLIDAGSPALPEG